MCRYQTAAGHRGSKPTPRLVRLLLYAYKSRKTRFGGEVVPGGSMVFMFTRCAADARGIFAKLLHKDVVAWTATTSRDAELGVAQEALNVYNHMKKGRPYS